MAKQISPLRQRMIDDMAIRNMSPNTQKIYTYAIANFSAFHGRSPDKLGLEDVRDYHLHLVSRNLKPTTINPIMGALRFFYGTTLGQKHVADQIPYARRADSLPAVFSREEVERFLKAVPNLKMRTAFITSRSPCIRCGTVSPRICWSSGSTSASFRTCSVIATSLRRPATPAWPSTRSGRFKARSNY
jgi:integrase/recombinase XerD